MRHQLGWSDLAGRRVGVYGLGVEGQTALRRLEGITDDLILVDDEPKQLDGQHVMPLLEGGAMALHSCDVILKSPGISRYSPLFTSLDAVEIPVVGGIGLTLHEIDRSKVICVTGTKGKSTTSALLGHLGRSLGLKVEVTGNIGLPPFDPDLDLDVDLLVIETSSFQALDVADAPEIVVVTSLDVDHVDWHRSAEQYHRDKLSLTSLPEAGVTVAQRRSPLLVAHEELLGGQLHWVRELAGDWAEPLGLVGEHNLANAQLAVEALRHFGVDASSDPEQLRTAAEGYGGLPGRLQLIASLGGVDFVDDSLATNVLPTLAALDAFEGRRLVLLLGGYDRGIDYDSLLDVLANRSAPTLVIGLPDSGLTLVDRLRERTTTTETTTAATIEAAVTRGATWANGEGVVLLSPAAPSFSQFVNWRERSAAFSDAVTRLR